MDEQQQQQQQQQPNPMVMPYPSFATIPLFREYVSLYKGVYRPEDLEHVMRYDQNGMMMQANRPLNEPLSPQIHAMLNGELSYIFQHYEYYLTDPYSRMQYGDMCHVMFVIRGTLRQVPIVSYQGFTNATFNEELFRFFRMDDFDYWYAHYNFSITSQRRHSYDIPIPPPAGGEGTKLGG